MRILITDSDPAATAAPAPAPAPAAVDDSDYDSDGWETARVAWRAWSAPTPADDSDTDGWNFERARPVVVVDGSDGSEGSTAAAPGASPALARLARRRGAQRWSALVSAPGSRLARQMRPHLGAVLWSEFVAHANRHYKARWLRAFAPASGVLRCVGALDGAPCAHGALVDLRDGTGAETRDWRRAKREVGAALECLHLDHERPLRATCHRWRAAMPAAPRSWDDGLDGAALCHDLFGVSASAAHGPACVQFRCGPPRDAEGVVLQFVDHAYCHRP